MQVLKETLDDVAMPIHFVGPDGTIIWANQAELDMLGYQPQEYIGRSIEEFHVDSPVIREILKRLQSGSTLIEHPARLRCKDGSIKNVEIHSNVYWEESEFVHTRCFTRDVTEQVRVEELMLELSAPILEIDRHLLLLPLVGALNKQRADFIATEVLKGISRYRARAVVMDLTGTAEVENDVLDTLLVLCRSCRGLGAEVVLSGISPIMAENLVRMQVPVDEFTAVGSLRDSIELAKEWILSPRRGHQD